MPRSLAEILAEYEASRATPIGERRANILTQSLVNLLGFPNVGGPKTSQEYEQDYQANLQRPDLMALSARAGVPLPEMARPFSKKSLQADLAVSPAATTGQKVEDFAVAALPYVAAGALTSPIATTQEALAAASGKGLLSRIVRGQVAQEAAFAPSTILSSDTLPQAALTMAAGVGLGSAAGRLLHRSPKISDQIALADEFGRGDVGELIQSHPITQAVREAQARGGTPTTITPRIKSVGEFTPRPAPPLPPPPPQPGAIARAVREAQARGGSPITITPRIKEVGEFTPRPRIPTPPPIPPENLVPIAPLKTPTGEIAVGTPEAKSLTEGLQAKVSQIRATAEASQAAAQKQWPGWTPQKEQLYQNLTEKGVSEAQAKHLLEDTAMAGRFATSLRNQGMGDLADALEGAVGKPIAPEVLPLKDALAQSLESLGPAATKTMSDAVDEMPPGLAKRFLDNSEAGFIRRGKPMTAGNLIDRVLHWRLGGMLSGASTVVGNVSGNTVSAGGLIPQRALAAPISQVGKLVFGRGPTLSVKEAGYQTLGYMQGLANLIQGVRKRHPVGMVPGEVRRFSELSRTVRVMQEGADPFAEAGTIGTVVGAIPNATLKYGLEVPDKIMWDPIFTGNALTWAHRKAIANGAKGAGVDREMKRLLAEANNQAITASTRAKSFVRSEAKTIAQKRAGAAGTKAIGSAEKLLAQARKSKVGLPEAADALRIAREQADEAMRTAELTPAEIELIERGIMRELEPDIIKADVSTLKSLMDEARLLTERTMFMAREGKKLDASVDYILRTPVFDRLRKIILPILRTPANGVREAIRTSPVGGPLAFVKLLQAGGYRQFRESGMEQIPAMAAAMKSVDDAGLVKLYDDLAQATYGTGIMYGVYAALDHGLIKVVPYTPGMRREERMALEAQGIPTDSLVIGNWAIPLRRLEPIARGIRAADRLLRLNSEKPDDEIFNAAEALAKEYVVAAADDVWLAGIQEVMSAATDDASAAGYANKLGGSFVPRFAQQAGSLVRGERVSRKPTEGFFKELIKGPHQALGIGKPDLGMFGRPRTTTALYGLTGFSMRADDPLLQELTKVDYFPSTRLPQIDLSEGESQDATQAKGFIQEQALKALIANPDYQSLETPELKKKVLQREIDRVGARVGKVIRARKAAGMSLSYADLLQVLTQ